MESWWVRWVRLFAFLCLVAGGLYIANAVMAWASQPYDPDPCRFVSITEAVCYRR
jgi:hypothetical protein